MIYYRVAFQVEQSPTWVWKSTALTSLEALFGFLRHYRALPPERLRVFSSPSKETLNEQLARENQGGACQSVTAARFLQERKVSLPAMIEQIGAHGAAVRPIPVSVAVSDDRSLQEGSTLERFLPLRGISAVERRRIELEGGLGGDHDTPYTFALPASLLQVLAWVRLLARVRTGVLEP